MKIISVYNIKGGVGKTTICVNLASIAAHEGFRTLLVDLDPQGAASFYFRIKPVKKLGSKKFLSSPKKVFKAVRGSDYENLDLIPASLSLRNLDIRLTEMKKSQSQLSAVLKQFENDYDIIFIDSPPNITLLSENIFNASDMMIIPVIPTTLSVLAYEKLIKFLKEKKYKKLHTSLLLSMVEMRKTMQKLTIEKLLKDKENMFNTRIPYKTEIERMGVYREPVVVKHPRLKVTKLFMELWDEVKTIIELKVVMKKVH